MKIGGVTLSRSNVLRVVLSLAFMVGVFALFWWRGPSFTAIGETAMRASTRSARKPQTYRP